MNRDRKKFSLDLVNRKFSNFRDSHDIGGKTEDEATRGISLAREVEAKYRFLSKTNYRLATEEGFQLLIQLVSKYKGRGRESDETGNGRRSRHEEG